VGITNGNRIRIYLRQRNFAVAGAPWQTALSSAKGLTPAQQRRVRKNSNKLLKAS
jgi:hypothetical protein